MGAAKQLAQGVLVRSGYELQRVEDAREKQRLRAHASSIVERHRRQTLDDVNGLNAKYRGPIFGRVRVWDLFPVLARCIDPSDPEFGCVSQLTHTLQVIEGMRDDGVSDSDLLLCALIHDLGKVLLAGDEDPANVGGLNAPIGVFEDGVGFDNCVFQWNHDEFAYSRFRHHVADHVAWLIRYHSARFELAEVQRLMDDRDKLYTERYYRAFSRHDFSTKSIFGLPNTRIEDYRELIESAFPHPIQF